jgi:hypothetical protein
VLRGEWGNVTFHNVNDSESSKGSLKIQPLDSLKDRLNGYPIIDSKTESNESKDVLTLYDATTWDSVASIAAINGNDLSQSREHTDFCAGHAFYLTSKHSQAVKWIEGHMFDMNPAGHYYFQSALFWIVPEC